MEATILSKNSVLPVPSVPTISYISLPSGPVTNKSGKTSVIDGRLPRRASTCNVFSYGLQGRIQPQNIFNCLSAPVFVECGSARMRFRLIDRNKHSGSAEKTTLQESV
ncbi:hypothetical protein KUTeg_021967 [Tegillarca granosa]|uniref:Uncharacterized protein n=1 Tax=Tegillarca granosa TaxID=220873 RepID=A0ABQ9EB15_TEGGR|nr:hypothetical protein KUTeg_021967 [Tegillarca granosa]